MKYSEALKNGIESGKYVQGRGSARAYYNGAGRIRTCAAGIIALELGLTDYDKDIWTLIYEDRKNGGDWETFCEVMARNDDGATLTDILAYLEEQGL